MIDRNELVVANLRLAPYYVRRFLSRYRVPPALGLEVEDLVGEALLALCRAADKWEPSRGAFTTYASAVIHNWLLKVCRLNRDSLIDRLEFVSLCAPVGENGDESLMDMIPDVGEKLEEQVYETQLRADLRDAVLELPDRDRTIIQGLLEGRTVANIARDHGCSRQRIEYIQGRAIRRLRERLTRPSGKRTRYHTLPAK